MHFRKMLNTDNLSAEDFVDGNFTPILRTLTIKSVVLATPPAAGKDSKKPLFSFVETDKTAFIANGEIKKIARQLRKTDTDQWVGAKVEITSGPKKFKGQDTTGMIVVRAFFPQSEAKP